MCIFSTNAPKASPTSAPAAANAGIGIRRRGREPADEASVGLAAPPSLVVDAAPAAARTARLSRGS
jgi:hypothetical protein